MARERSESEHEVLLMDLVRTEMLFWLECWTVGGIVVSMVDGTWRCVVPELVLVAMLVGMWGVGVVENWSNGLICWIGGRANGGVWLL